MSAGTDGGEIIQGLATLDMELDELAASIASLDSQLTAVLSPASPEAVGPEAELEGSSHVGERIARASRNARNARYHVNSISGRIQL